MAAGIHGKDLSVANRAQGMPRRRERYRRKLLLNFMPMISARHGKN
jgi:hypothetical protein